MTKVSGIAAAVASAVGNGAPPLEHRLRPARLDVAMPFELPDGAKESIARAIAGEAWLERLGLTGLLTGIATNDMRTFENSVERLAGMLRYARETGMLEGSTEFEVDLESVIRTWRLRVGCAVFVGAFVGAALMAIAAGVA